MTQTLTTDELRQIVETDHVQCGDAAAMARELLANREAQPVYQMRLLDGSPEQNTWVEVTYEEFNLPLKNPGEWSKRVLFTAPPAPAVPGAAKVGEMPFLGSSEPVYVKGWNACRAAMLAQPVSQGYKLPMQPLVIDTHGALRFKQNPIVRRLLDYATEHGYGLNEIAMEQFEADDQMQLAQLIGYSLSGYGTLSYVTDESYDRAAAAAPEGGNDA